MTLFDFFKITSPLVRADDCKIHLATWNGTDDPLEVYLAGQFDEWQKWQSRRNFERPYVIALIALPSKHSWLFTGLYSVHGCVWNEDRQYHNYDLRPDSSTAELQGRLVISFSRAGRQVYLNADR